MRRAPCCRRHAPGRSGSKSAAASTSSGSILGIPEPSCSPPPPPLRSLPTGPERLEGPDDITIWAQEAAGVGLGWREGARGEAAAVHALRAAPPSPESLPAPNCALAHSFRLVRPQRSSVSTRRSTENPGLEYHTAQHGTLSILRRKLTRLSLVKATPVSPPHRRRFPTHLPRESGTRRFHEPEPLHP